MNPSLASNERCISPALSTASFLSSNSSIFNSANVSTCSSQFSTSIPLVFCCQCSSDYTTGSWIAVPTAFLDPQNNNGNQHANMDLSQFSLICNSCYFQKLSVGRSTATNQNLQGDPLICRYVYFLFLFFLLYHVKIKLHPYIYFYASFLITARHLST